MKKGQLTKAGLTIVDNVVHKALAAFANTAASAIPMDTGMARGSFLNIRTMLESKGLSMSTNIPEEALILRSPYIHANGERYSKEPYSGAALSTKPESIYKRIRGKGKITFESRVVHLNINDMYPASSPLSPPEVSRNWSKNKRPWRSFAQGQESFIQSFINSKDQLEDFGSFFTATTVTKGKHSTFPSSFRISRQKKVL